MLAERKGFEPSHRVTDLHAFQACPFSLLGTSPILNAPILEHFGIAGVSGGNRTRIISLGSWGSTIELRLQMVRVARFELARRKHYRLKIARLPIPPYPQFHN